MFCGKLFHEIGVRKNVRHSLGNYLAACLVITHSFALRLFRFNKVVYVFSALCKGIKYHFSELIIPYRIPFFNKMAKFVRKSAKHCIFCKVVYTLDISKSCVDINIDRVLAPLEFALRSLKHAVGVGFGFEQHNINAGRLCIGGKDLISRILRIVERALKIRDRHDLTPYGAFSAACFAVCLCLVRRVLLLCCGRGRVCACRVCKLALLLGKICRRLAVHSVGKGNAALAHIIGNLIRRVILRYVLTLGIGADHCPCLRSVFLRRALQGNGAFFCLDNLRRGLNLRFCRVFLRGGVLGRGNGLCFLHVARLRRFYVLRGFFRDLLRGSRLRFLRSCLGLCNQSAVFFGIDSVGTDTLCPSRRISTGVDVFGVQLVCHALTEFTVAYSTLFCVGELFADCLFGKSFSNSLYIASFSKLDKAVFCRATNGSRVIFAHCRLIRINKSVDLIA